MALPNVYHGAPINPAIFQQSGDSLLRSLAQPRVSFNADVGPRDNATALAILSILLDQSRSDTRDDQFQASLAAQREESAAANKLARDELDQRSNQYEQDRALRTRELDNTSELNRRMLELNAKQNMAPLIIALGNQMAAAASTRAAAEIGLAEDEDRAIIEEKSGEFSRKENAIVEAANSIVEQYATIATSSLGATDEAKLGNLLRAKIGKLNDYMNSNDNVTSAIASREWNRIRSDVETYAELVPEQDYKTAGGFLSALASKVPFGTKFSEVEDLQDNRRYLRNLPYSMNFDSISESPGTIAEARKGATYGPNVAKAKADYVRMIRDVSQNAIGPSDVAEQQQFIMDQFLSTMHGGAPAGAPVIDDGYDPLLNAIRNSPGWEWVEEIGPKSGR